MYIESDQMTEFNKSALDTALQLSQIALNSTEKLVGLQWVSTRQSLADAHNVLQPETDLWDLPTLLGLRAKLTEKTVENAATYLRSIYEVAAYTKNQIADLFTLQWREWSKNINSQLPLVVYGSAHIDRTLAPQGEAQVQKPAEAIDPSEVSKPLVRQSEVIPVSQSVAEVPVQAEVIVASQSVAEVPVQAEAVEFTVQEPVLSPTFDEPVRVAETLSRAHKTTITASDFSAGLTKPAAPAMRSGKTTKPAAEKTKAAVAKKKPTAKR